MKHACYHWSNKLNLAVTHQLIAGMIETLDLETSGLPSQECNKTKITELSMVAVKRPHILETRPGTTPRVKHKLTLCLNPRRMIQPDSTDVTGLCNDLLEHEPVFDRNVFSIINTFLEVLSKPVCLIAYNGLGFDFPILKRHLEVLNVNFSEDLLCADSFHAFYDILEKKSAVLKESQKNCLNSEKSNNEPAVHLSPDMKSMQTLNETTPKASVIVPSEPSTPSKNYRSGAVTRKARKKLPWSEGSKPKISFKLSDIYKRLLNKPAIDAHHAEADCLMMIECAGVISKEFVLWIDEHHKKYADVPAMTLGTPLGE